MNPVIQEIAERVANQFNISPNEISSIITTPPDQELGDYSLPCFVLAQSLKRAPHEIAEEVANTLSGGVVTNTSTAGPYVNITVDKPVLLGHILGQVLSQRLEFGSSKDGKDKKILIDFSSPNIARPFGIAHIRSTALGNALKKIYQHLGYDVVGINHLGDWGVQFGTLISAYKRWGDEQKIEEDSIYELFRLYVKFNEEAEKDPALKDEARVWFKKLEDRDPEAFKMWEWFVDISLKAFQKYYDILGVEFEEVSGESAYRDQTAPLIDELIDRGIAEESEGALIIRLDEKEKSGEEMPPLILKTQDGTTVYATRDLCAARTHWEKYDFEKKIYAVDAGQSLHFRQLFKTLKLIGHEWADRLVHIPFGVMLFEDMRMSTRKGRVVFLEEVLDRAISQTREIIESIDKASNLSAEEKDQVAEQVGVSAIIYADMSRSRIHDINFRWKEVLNFQGKSGPYIQYTHARMSGVLRKYGKEVSDSSDYSALHNPSEISLIRMLENFPERVRHAAAEYEPFAIAEYLGDLAVSINKFYEHCPVLGEEPALEEARIAVVYCAQIVLKKGLELLGMSAPERM
jgi:arginyl-tRNA synthetase